MSQWPYRAVATALEVIPRTLIQNCGGNSIRTITQIRAKHAEGSDSFGVNGETGEVCDMAKLGVWEPLSVKSQVLKTSVEVSPSFLYQKRNFKHALKAQDILEHS